MKKVISSIRYKIKKFYLLNFVPADRLALHKLNEEQKNGVSIFQTLVLHPDSEILMAPLSGKYYIKNEELFIVLDLNMISIINSVYHYDIYYEERETRYLAAYARRIIERRREKLEREMRSKINKSLTHLAKEVKIKFNKKGEE